MAKRNNRSIKNLYEQHGQQEQRQAPPSPPQEGDAREQLTDDEQQRRALLGIPVKPKGSDDRRGVGTLPGEKARGAAGSSYTKTYKGGLYL